MAIQDLAGNPFSTASSPMIGFVPAAGAGSELGARTLGARALTLHIYKFLIEGIREEDQTKGARFVERFLEGPQQTWARLNATIRSLPDMWSITKCDDRFLPYLKWIVGWTSELDYITDDLDSATLRRLIATSVPFWKTRGNEDSLAEILRLTTASRVRIWSWFDLRYISDETGVGEEHQGHDPWMIDLPGPPDYEENRINVRIVDDGTVNHRLVRNLVRLTRPSGERIVISYIGFLDLFTTDDDSSQWEESSGTASPVVANGTMTLTTDVAVHVNADGSGSWQNYVVSVRARGQVIMLEAYRTGDGDSYVVYVDTANSLGVVYRALAGVSTILVSVSTMTSMAWKLDQTLFYTLRVAMVPEAGATRITMWLDGNFIASVVDSGHSQGTIGLAGLYSVSPTEVDEVEMFFNPLEEDFIDIVGREVEIGS